MTLDRYEGIELFPIEKINNTVVNANIRLVYSIYLVHSLHITDL